MECKCPSCQSTFEPYRHDRLLHCGLQHALASLTCLVPPNNLQLAEIRHHLGSDDPNQDGTNEAAFPLW